MPNLATTGPVTVNAVGQTNIGFGSGVDSIYRNITVPITASGSTMHIQFADNGSLQGLADESWGIDNVRVYDASTNALVYSTTFENGAGAEWSTSQTDDTYPTSFTQFLGRFSNGQATLSLAATAGKSYTLVFDFYAIDSWDGSDPNAGPDAFKVGVDGTTVFNQTFSNSGGLQSYHNGSGSVTLQVVPTLTGISGLPGTDGAFTLYGSGFMDAATTLTVGGLTRVDQYTNQGDPTVSGARNDTLSGLVMPTAVQGTIRVTTAGGWAQLTIPAAAAPPFVEFDALTAVTTAGTPANAAAASAVVGQTITLVGRGFNNSTVVQFPAEDQAGVAGVLGRTGSASADGTTLTITVPAQAVTGMLHVVGAGGSFELQVVPTLRSVGGAITVGQNILIEGTGLAAGQLTVTIGGQTATLATGAVHDLFADGMSEQAVDVTVPAGIVGGLITVTTPGGTFTLQANATLSTPAALTPAADPGDTISTSLALGLSENTVLTVNQQIGDGPNGANDVDLYSFTGAAGDLVTVDMGATYTNPYPDVRLFDATGNQLAIDYYYQEPEITAFVLPSSGKYYVGVSSSNNVGYDPTKANSGSGGNDTGSYTMSVTLASGKTTSLASIAATAATGTAARASIASANPGQTITLTGSGLRPTDQVVFEYVDQNSGSVGWTTVSPVSVAANGTSLTVVVPTSAASGTVRLAREQVGLFLQVVPTVTNVDENSSTYHGGSADAGEAG